LSSSYSGSFLAAIPKIGVAGVTIVAEEVNKTIEVTYTGLRGNTSNSGNDKVELTRVFSVCHQMPMGSQLPNLSGTFQFRAIRELGMSIKIARF
jgi:hypothetical protein